MLKKTIYKLIFVLLLIICFFFFSNNYIQVSKYDYRYNGNKDYTIVHISDLHNKDFGNRLINKIKKQNPNIIVITGDIIDSKKKNLSIAYKFAKECTNITTTYFVSGNHDVYNEYIEIITTLENYGVIVLEDKNILLDENINLIGMKDIYGRDIESFSNQLNNLVDNKRFNLLLSHRPELIDIYIENNIDLVFSGHTHGGQWRIPFINKGIIAPNQGFFPKYSEGMIVKNNTTMIVSRGLGNSIIPLRIFNQPELIITTLKIE